MWGNGTVGCGGTTRNTAGSGLHRVTMLAVVGFLAFPVLQGVCEDREPGQKDKAPITVTARQPGDASSLKSSNRIRLGSTHLQMIPPVGCRSVVESGGNAKMSYYSEDGSFVVTLQIRPDRFEPGLLLSEKAKAILSKRYPSASVLTELDWYMGSSPGRILDFQRTEKATNKSSKTRLAVAKLPDGLLEIWFTAPDDQFNASLGACNQLMRSLRMDEPVMVAEVPASAAGKE